jgi:hypothetical protein
MDTKHYTADELAASAGRSQARMSRLFEMEAVLLDLDYINQWVHKVDRGESTSTAEDNRYMTARADISNAGYYIHEVEIWDDDDNEIIRHDLVIAPRM